MANYNGSQEEQELIKTRKMYQQAIAVYYKVLIDCNDVKTPSSVEHWPFSSNIRDLIHDLICSSYYKLK